MVVARGRTLRDEGEDAVVEASRELSSVKKMQVDIIQDPQGSTASMLPSRIKYAIKAWCSAVRGSDYRSELLKGQPPLNVLKDLPNMLQEGASSFVANRLPSEHRGPAGSQPRGRLLSAASKVPLPISDGRNADALGVRTPKRGSRNKI